MQFRTKNPKINTLLRTTPLILLLLYLGQSTQCLILKPFIVISFLPLGVQTNFGQQTKSVMQVLYYPVYNQYRLAQNYIPCLRQTRLSKTSFVRFNMARDKDLSRLSLSLGRFAAQKLAPLAKNLVTSTCCKFSPNIMIKVLFSCLTAFLIEVVRRIRTVLQSNLKSADSLSPIWKAVLTQITQLLSNQKHIETTNTVLALQELYIVVQLSLYFTNN